MTKKISILPVLALIALTACQDTITTGLTSSSQASPTPTASASSTPSATVFSISGIYPTSAIQSLPTQVAVYGAQFDSTTAIEIGGTLCTSATVVSSTEIDCIIQISQFGSYTVSAASSSQGIAIPLVNGFQVTALSPTLNLSTSFVSQGTVSGGTHLVISGTHFLSGAQVTLGGFTCLSTSVIPPNQITCITPPHSEGLVDLTVLNPDAQSTTVPSAFNYYDPNSAASQLYYASNPAIYPLSYASPASPIPSNTPIFTTTSGTTYSISPSLPSGLTLNTTTGIISGTPTSQSTSQPYTVIANNPSRPNVQMTLQLGIVDFGNGATPFPTPTTTGVVINTYSYLSSTASSATNVLNVESTTGFSAGDLILIIQMQTGASSPLPSWEFARIQSIASGTQMSTQSNLSNTYTTGANDDATQAKVTQVVKVPEYSTVDIPLHTSITASSWNGKTGGIIAFKASNSVTVEGEINGTGVGFRGGNNNTGNNVPSYALAGESYFNYPNSAGAPGASNAIPATGSGGGGGGYDSSTSGSGCSYTLPSPVPSPTCITNGGGGSYNTLGQNGDGTYAAVVGAAGNSYGNTTLDSLMLGSGGGGANTNFYCARSTIQAASGGGIIFIISPVITLNGGSISANGGDARLVCSNVPLFSGTSASLYTGAGSGGSIYLKAGTLNIGYGQVSALGGKGSDQLPNGPGSGGAGRIRLDYGNLYGAPIPAPNFTTLP